MSKAVTKIGTNNSFFAMLKSMKTPGVSIITHEKTPIGVFISIDAFEGLMETLDIMSDPAEAAAIEEAIKDKEKGDVISYEEFKKDLKL